MDDWLAFALSKSFLEASKRCKISPNEDCGLPMMFPGLVCAAFSAEVGLKSLLLHQGIKSRGHDLLSLFKSLPIDYKVAIIQKIGMEPEPFYVSLNAAKNAFPDWRYVYEIEGEKMISMAFLDRLAVAIVEFGDELKLWPKAK